MERSLRTCVAAIYLCVAVDQRSSPTSNCERENQIEAMGMLGTSEELDRTQITEKMERGALQSRVCAHLSPPSVSPSASPSPPAVCLRRARVSRPSRWSALSALKWLSISRL